MAAWAFDHLPISALVVDEQANGGPRVVQVNRALARRMGVEKGDVVGSLLQQVLPGTDFATLAREAGAARAFEGTLALRAGGSQEVSLIGSPMVHPGGSGCLVVLVDDLSSRSDAERALRESAKRLEDIVDNVNALIYLKAADGTYLWLNRAYENMLQIPRETVLGNDDFSLWPHDIAAVYSANDRVVVEAGRPMEFEEPIPSAETGTGMWLTLKFPLYDEDGTPYAVGGISTDISDRNRTEALVRRAMEEAERANQAKSEFLSRMSHELRTPLNSIIGFAQLVRTADLSVEDADSVQHVLRASRHLLALINEVLEISRIESGVEATSVETVPACDPLIEAMELVGPLAAERGIELARDLHGAVHRFVWADHQRLTQVLLNVLTNAVKYNVDNGTITVTADVLEDRLRYRIMDTGFGIAPRNVERVFTPFDRLGISAGDIEGTGLGLALSRSMIEAMGGAIGVERTVPGRGSVFYVDVRISSADSVSDRIVSPAVEPPVEERLDLHTLTIVYIEDNLANLELVKRILEQHGDPTLIPAMQGGLGVEFATLYQPDLVLLDLHLPDMDGDEVLRRLQADERTRDIPVLILSADATPSQVDRLRAAGATDYVTKPLDIRSFLRSVRAAVGPGPN
ncbi:MULTISPECIES: hybrid sensor histidine kinase/response regulator [unclassified Nocardioides]|uniref:hybrid sensor histidine kinase/response regulator n=1 Tax=unclassified Nocardioides TaxID=2615069 RepID=UPI001F60C122|nr:MULTISPECIES: PAS domain-containing hybrid sensor histidine kinase/response regulator [unclassified Nocardioides]